MAFISVQDVCKYYATGAQRVVAADHISFTAEKGEFVVVVGHSGAGKTTVLNILGGMDNCDSGHIFVDGKDIAAYSDRQLTAYRRHDVGFVFQFYNLVQNLTALENVELAAEICAHPLDAATVLREVGLGDRLQNFPAQLSGGEQQRVSLARALVNNPKLIIADEPTGNVDPEMSQEIVEMLTKINNGGTTVIMVTHEHSLVRAFPRRVIVIKNGEVVSDTPDPSHAQFESDEPQKSTDMYFFNEDVKLGSDIEDIFDSIESDNKSNPENSETPATQAQETIDGGEE